MAEYSGEKALLGTGVAPDPLRRTAGAMPPDTQAARDAARAYDEAAETRAAEAAAIDPANRPPALGAPPVLLQTAGGVTAAPAGLGIGEDRADGIPTEAEKPPALEEAQRREEAGEPLADEKGEPEGAAETVAAKPKGKAKG